MDIKCPTLHKVKLLLFFTLAIGINIFAQKNELLEVYSTAGIFDSFNKERELLYMIIDDSLVTFEVNNVFLNQDSYSTLINQYNNWESSNDEVQLLLNYFINVYFDSTTNKVKHKLLCVNLEKEDLLDSINTLFIPKYDTTIYELSGNLKRVEVGDYLHIQIVDNSKAHNFWINPELTNSTLNKLYNLEGSDLNITVYIRYYKAVNWIPEYGEPMLNLTCIDLIFKD